MYRKYVAPLSEGRVIRLFKLYAKNAFQTYRVFDDFEYCLGQLYKVGIIQTKK